MTTKEFEESVTPLIQQFEKEFPLEFGTITILSIEVKRVVGFGTEKSVIMGVDIKSILNSEVHTSSS